MNRVATLFASPSLLFERFDHPEHCIYEADGQEETKRIAASNLFVSCRLRTSRTFAALILFNTAVWVLRSGSEESESSSSCLIRLSSCWALFLNCPIVAMLLMVEPSDSSSRP